MHACFPAIYRDRNGEVSTELVIDGCEMRLVVRGVEFSGLDFDALEPNPESDPTKVAGFTLQHGCLVSCEIIFTMPLPVVVGDALTTNPLHLRIEVPREEPGVWNWAKAYLALTIGD